MIINDCKDEVQTLIGDISLTLVLPIRIAIELGVGKGEFLKCRVDGDRLILEKKYRNVLSSQTRVMEDDH
jgi:bifunctional DNA-binding transcriptional regulator/antitoxin component of YhaV-PrlF toxin-antitoxin module